MHQVSLETIGSLQAFKLHYCPDNDAKSMVKHFIFLQKFAVIRGFAYVHPLVHLAVRPSVGLLVCGHKSKSGKKSI